MRRLPIALALLLALALAALLAWTRSRAPAFEEHVVVRGDTLTRIARQRGVSVDALREWNGIEGDLIEVGQVLRYIPEGDVSTHESSRVSTRATTRVDPSLRAAAQPEDGAPSALAGLSLPPAEPCLPFDPDPGEQGMVAPEGLSPARLRASLDAVLPRALGCPHDAPGRWRPVFELVVGCDGRVASVVALEDGGAPEDWLGCAREVLRHADFPAHDMADGMRFTYPVTVEL